MRNTSIAYKSLSRYALVACLSAGSMATQAACKQADLTGTWLVSGLSTITYDAPNHEQASFTTFCKIKVDKKGVFTKSGSTCNSSAGATTIEGSMKISGKTCNVKAFPMKVFSNGAKLFDFTVDFMALDKGKTNFTATGNKDSATTGMAQFIW